MREPVEPFDVLGFDFPPRYHQDGIGEGAPVQFFECLDKWSLTPGRKGSVARLKTCIGVLSFRNAQWLTRSDGGPVVHD